MKGSSFSEYSWLALTVVITSGTAVLLPVPAFSADRLLKQDWWLLESEHFQLVTNTRGNRSEDIIRDLELFRSVVLKLTSIETVEERIPTTAVVFNKTGEFNRLTNRPNIAGYMRAGLRRNWMVSGGDRLSMDQRQIMFHEYVHHLLRSASTVNYPTWYDEGLADMLSSVYEKDGKVVVGADAPSRIQTLKNNSMQVSLERIVNSDDLSDWHRYHVSYFYAMSWALVNYLNFGHLLGTPNRVGELQKYLALVQQGVSRPEAFSTAFDMTPATMELNVNRYLGTRLRPVLNLPREWFPEVDNVNTRQLTNAEASFILARLALYSNVSLARALLSESAEDREQEARRRGLLAVTYQLASEYQTGAQLAHEAVQMDPVNPELAIDLADLLIAWNRSECQSATTVCTDRLMEARQFYQQALDQAPDNPEAHAQLAALLNAQGVDLASAAAHIEVALSYQRWSDDLNLLAGQIYLSLEDSERARAHLQRALNWSENETIRSTAAKALAELTDDSRQVESPE